MMSAQFAMGFAMSFLRAAPLVAFAVIVGSPLPALAAKCKSSGGLTYLGNTRDGSRSVWLSLTRQGSFALEAAQGNQTVDTWGVPPDRRLHISASPVVSNGNGGTHKLYETSDDQPCLMDTHNQKRDWTIPPNLLSPEGLMPTRPPIGGLFPEFGPPTGLMPTLPGGVQPPIGTLPPTGITPTLPGGVQPPIGTLPPTGITPTLPGGVQPPIGTLPPTGITPTLPGGVQPPIGTLPPTGITPTLPGGVQPPIGTLPPTGITPTLPGGVQPPIGTLPPTGITPTLPGGVQPPIGTLPPGVIIPPGGGSVVRLADGTLVRSVAGTAERCIDPRTPPSGGEARWPICPAEILAEADRNAEVPLTEGRDLGEPTLWNAWVQPLFVQVSDERYGLDMDTQLSSVTFGLDRRFGDNVVLGASFAYQNSSTEGFSDLLQADSGGFSIGPYLAVRLSPHWAIDASLSYGQYDNDLELSVLEGSFDSRQWSGNIAAHGQYTFGEYFVRPKASLTYSYIESDGYDLKGNVLGLPIDVVFPEDSFNFGIVEASTELSRIFVLESGTTVMPFAEIGAIYAFDQPNDGQILTADLELATPSAWSGTLRAGARMLLNDSVQVEASGGYLSLGQSGLDVWEGKLQVSFGF